MSEAARLTLHNRPRQSPTGWRATFSVTQEPERRGVMFGIAVHDVTVFDFTVPCGVRLEARWLAPGTCSLSVLIRVPATELPVFEAVVPASALVSPGFVRLVMRESGCHVETADGILGAFTAVEPELVAAVAASTVRYVTIIAMAFTSGPNGELPPTTDPILLDRIELEENPS